MLTDPKPGSRGRARVQRGSLDWVSTSRKKHKQGLRSQQKRTGRFGSPGYNLLLKTTYQKITGLTGYLETGSDRAEADLSIFRSQEP